MFLVAWSIRIVIILDLKVFSSLTIINNLIISWTTRRFHLLTLHQLTVLLMNNELIKITLILMNPVLSFIIYVVQFNLINFFILQFQLLPTDFSSLVHSFQFIISFWLNYRAWELGINSVLSKDFRASKVFLFHLLIYLLYYLSCLEYF